MKKFVVYEVWTQARVIEAKDERDAYNVGAPQSRNDGLSLCNWHVVEIPKGTRDADAERDDFFRGGLNYRQEG